MRALIIILALTFAAPAAAEKVTFDNVQMCSAKLAEQVARRPEYAVRNLWKHGWETFDDVPADEREIKLRFLTDAMRENLADVASHINFGNDRSRVKWETYGVDDEEFLFECAGLAPEVTANPEVGEIDPSEVIAAVSQCWNVGSLSADALATSVEVFFSMDGNRPLSSSIRMGEYSGGSEAAARQMFESARRAILRCGARGMDLSVPDSGELTAVFSLPE